MSRQLVFNAIWNRAAHLAALHMYPDWCACLGPQNGEPECPCRMRIERGRKAIFILARPVAKRET